MGNTLTVVRPRANGSLGCSVPCVMCRRELLRFELRVKCVTEDGEWFEGRLDEPGAPRSKLTSGQKKAIYG